MGQILLKDKIGTLSHSAGVITLQDSRLTIGGQQYSATSVSRTITDDVTLLSCRRYQVFAVVIAGVVQLRISLNENSQGPAGFNSWKLVGSFMADDFAAFGSFLNITGVPVSNWMDWDLRLYRSDTLVESGSLASNPLAKQIKFQRVGEVLKVDCRYQHATGNNTGVSDPAHNVSVVFKGPGYDFLNYSSEIGYGTTLLAQGIMTSNSTTPGGWTGNATQLGGGLFWATGISFQNVTSGVSINANLVGSTASLPNFLPGTNAADFRFGYKHEVVILDWSNTPIEDL